MNRHRWLSAAICCGILATTLVSTTSPARSQGATEAQFMEWHGIEMFWGHKP